MLRGVLLLFVIEGSVEHPPSVGGGTRSSKGMLGLQSRMVFLRATLSQLLLQILNFGLNCIYLNAVYPC